jgi:hypothetical protein
VLLLSRLSTMLNIMRGLLLIWSIIMTSQILAVEVYMTVDENGNPVFTDQASEGAKKVEVKEVITVPGLENPRPYEGDLEPINPYDSVSISHPTDDQTYFRSEGDMVVQVEVSPRLRSSDKIVYTLNGNVVQSGKSTSFRISEMERGTHSISVSIIGPDESVIKSSPAIIFHMRQASALGK